MEILLRRRKGIAKNLTLDCDAAALLPLLSPGHKGHGRLVSELLRQEADRREARARYVATGKPPWRNEDDK